MAQLAIRKVDTDAGITGLGEASLQGLNKAVEVAVHNLENEYFIGKDPRQIQSIGPPCTVIFGFTSHMCRSRRCPA